MRNGIILLALIVTLAVPFLLSKRHANDYETQDTLVIITPHNEAIRYEFGHGFERWYFANKHRTVSVDWRVIGGTSEIARYLESSFITSFQNYWTGNLNKNWDTDIQAAFANGKLPEDASSVAKEARAAFLSSDVGCGIDLFFGGGPYDFINQARAGRIVDSGILQKHPEWFLDNVIPQTYAGEEYWDKKGRWIGTVLSSYGIIGNRDALKRLKIEDEPRQWEDLKDPHLYGQIGLADPTKSSSIAKAFENVIQQQIQKRWKVLEAEGSSPQQKETVENRAIREGWVEGLKLLQLIGANSRYFTDTSQKPPIDVAQGVSAVGMCIDFYGRQQEEAVRRRNERGRLYYASPSGGTVSSVDPIALLRGAKNKAAALAFIEYVLSMDGQQLWNFRPGTPGGPERFALRRLPVRRDYYNHSEFLAFRSDPEDQPFDQKDQLIYKAAWTSGLFREMAFITRVMCIDTHEELQTAWKAVIAAGLPPAAVDALQDLSLVNYDQASNAIRQALSSKNKVDELNLAKGLADNFRANYAKAIELARAGL